MERPRIEVIDRDYAAVLAAKTPAERVAIACAAHRSARAMLASRIGELMPTATAERRRNEGLRRLLGHGADGYLATRGGRA